MSDIAAEGGHLGSLSSAYRLQSTIVHALLMRGMKSRHTRSRLGVVVNILEPVAMVFAIFAMRYYITGAAVVYGIPLAIFVTTGFMPYHFHRLTLSDITAATHGKMATLMFPLVTRLDNVLSRVINAFTIYAMGMAVTFLFVLSAYGGYVPNNTLQAFIAGYLVLWYSAALGVFFGCGVRLYPIVEVFVAPLVRVSLLVSGGLYLAVEVPPSILRIMRWNPLFHGIEMMREAFLNGYVSPIKSVPYLVSVCLALTVVALALERRTRNYKLS